MAGKILGKPCKKDSDCGSTSFACDTSSTGKQTYTCKILYAQYCLSNDQCVDNLQCNSLTCLCVRSTLFFFKLQWKK